MKYELFIHNHIVQDKLLRKADIALFIFIFLRINLKIFLV